MDMALVELREELDDALAAFQAASASIEEADESADLDKLEATFKDAEERYTTARTAHRDATDSQERARQRFALQQKAKDAKKLTEDPTPIRGRVSVGHEPLTYRRNGAHSIFSDLYSVSKGTNPGPAMDRLARHAREMEFNRQQNAGDVPRDAKFDLNSTDGNGGYLVAPLYLQNEFVNLARAGRVVANVVGPRDLPPNTDSINIPKLTTGTTVADQADNGSVSETDVTDETLTAAVKTKAGLQDVSQQLVDRSVPGIDEVIFADLAGDYAIKLDTDVINSSTANNKGLLQVSGINSVTYTDASPTLPELYPKLADAVQQIHTSIFRSATAIFMHPRRWGWCLAAQDTTNRPLIVPMAPMNPSAEFGGVVAEGLVGSIQGIPVYVDANIPITLGAGTNEDRIIVTRKEELFLWEDPAGPYLETFRDVGSGTLTVRFRLHNYWAQLNARRPKAISVISGTGLAAPTF